MRGVIGDIRKRIGEQDGFLVLLATSPYLFSPFSLAFTITGDYVCACVSSAQL